MPQSTSCGWKPRASRSRDADGRVVFGGFGGARKGGFAAGDDALHQIRRDVESGRAFGGIEHAQPAAGARADVEEAAAGVKCVDDSVHRLRDVRELRRDGIGHQAIFGVDDPQHFEGWKLVDVRGRGIRLLRQECVEVFRHSSLLYGRGPANNSYPWTRF